MDRLGFQSPGYENARWQLVKKPHRRWFSERHMLHQYQQAHIWREYPAATLGCNQRAFDRRRPFHRQSTILSDSFCRGDGLSYAPCQSPSTELLGPDSLLELSLRQTPLLVHGRQATNIQPERQRTTSLSHAPMERLFDDSSEQIEEHPVVSTRQIHQADLEPILQVVFYSPEQSLFGAS